MLCCDRCGDIINETGDNKKNCLACTKLITVVETKKNKRENIALVILLAIFFAFVLVILGFGLANQFPEPIQSITAD